MAQSGQLDPLFGAAGLATLDMGLDTVDRGLEIALQADDKIIVAGESNAPGAYGKIILFRLFPDGTLDTSFANAGVRVISSFNYAWQVRNLFVDDDDRIILVGQRSYGEAGVWRMLPDGTNDNTYGTGGMILLDPSNTFEFLDAELLTDGAVILAGFRYTSYYSHLLAKVTSAGVLDAGFGNGGYAYGATDDPTAHLKLVRALSSGAFICATNPGATELRLYGADGTADDAFGNQGVLVVPNSQVSTDMLVEPNDGLILLGQQGRVIRLGADLLADPSFGQAGIMEIDSITFAVDLERRPDGKYVAMGRRMYHACVAQFNNDGTPDLSFSGNGVSIVPTSLSEYSAWAGAVQNDGKILTTGGIELIDDQVDVCVNRWISDAPNGVTSPLTAPNAFSIAPVPCQAGGQLLLRGPNGFTDVDVTIMNAAGGVLFKTTVRRAFEQGGYVLELPSGLAGGLYAVVVEAGASSGALKLVVE